MTTIVFPPSTHDPRHPASGAPGTASGGVRDVTHYRLRWGASSPPTENEAEIAIEDLPFEDGLYRYALDAQPGDYITIVARDYAGQYSLFPRTVRLAAPLAAPSALAVAYDAEARRVHLAWSDPAGAAPGDLIVVYRAAGAAALAEVARVAAGTETFSEALAPGLYRYALALLRGVQYSPRTSEALVEVGTAVEAPRVVAPIANIAALEGAAPRTINLGAVFESAEPLTFTLRLAETGEPPVSASLAGSALTITFDAAPLAETIVVRATGSSGAYAEDTFAVTVRANTAPVATRLFSPVTGFTGAPSLVYDLYEYFEDADHHALTFTLRTEGGAAPVSAALAGSVLTVARATPAAETLIVRAADPLGAYAELALPVLLYDDTAPPSPAALAFEDVSRLDTPPPAPETLAFAGATAPVALVVGAGETRTLSPGRHEYTTVVLAETATLLVEEGAELHLLGTQQAAPEEPSAPPVVLVVDNGETRTLAPGLHTFSELALARTGTLLLEEGAVLELTGG